MMYLLLHNITVVTHASLEVSEDIPVATDDEPVHSDDIPVVTN